MIGWYDVSPEDLNTESRRVDAIQFLSRVRRHGEAERKLSKRVDKVIATDIYNLLYKDQPVIKPKEEQPDPALAEWMQQFTDKSEYSDTRMNTVRNVSNATIAAAKFYEDYMRRKDSIVKGLKQLKENKETVQGMMIDMPENRSENSKGIGEHAIDHWRPAEQ